MVESNYVPYFKASIMQARADPKKNIQRVGLKDSEARYRKNGPRAARTAFTISLAIMIWVSLVLEKCLDMFLQYALQLGDSKQRVLNDLLCDPLINTHKCGVCRDLIYH